MTVSSIKFNSWFAQMTLESQCGFIFKLYFCQFCGYGCLWKLIRMCVFHFPIFQILAATGMILFTEVESGLGK